MMNPLDALPAAAVARQVRAADRSDREQVSDLMLRDSHVHKHLDWKTPLDWLGWGPYMLALEGTRLLAALACPPDPPTIGWLRLFAFASPLAGEGAWDLLWPTARERFAAGGGGTVAAIVTQSWLEPILRKAGFRAVNHIVLMEMNADVMQPLGITPGPEIRPMVPADLPLVADVDASAFEPLWRNSLDGLASAFEQAFYASVVVDASGLLAYQLSTGGQLGTHLARLAVLPSARGRGLGAALVHDLVSHIPGGRHPRLTVNTQADNMASLALYGRLGFRRSGEQFPVYAISVPPQNAKGELH